MRDPEHKSLRIAAIGGRGMPSSYSGVERIWEELYPRLVDRGHEVVAYCRPGVADDSREYRGVRLTTTPAPGGRLLETLSHTRSAMRHAIRSRPAFDVIALHALPPQVFAGMTLWHGGVPPVVSHVHGLDWQRAKWRQTPLGVGSRVIKFGEQRMVRRAARVTVVADNLAEYYRDAYGLSTPVISNGIVPDDEPFEADGDVLRELGVEPRRFVVSIGRLVQEKRTQDTVAAFRAVGRHGLKLVIAGDGPDGAYLRSLKAIGGDNVIFAGHRTGRALETLFRTAAAYATASELEGLPSSVLEAMERGVPVVASDIPPHRQLLGPTAAAGFMFPVGDTAAMADRLRRAIDDPGGVAESQRAHVRAHYSWDVLAARFEALYREAAVQSRR